MRPSLALIPVGVVIMAVGLYWVGLGVSAQLSYEKNSASCSSPPPQPCSPPPPVWPLISLGAAVVVAGLAVTVLGFVNLRRDRRERRSPTGA